MQFWKVQASGNDFVLIDGREKKQSTSALKTFAKKVCDRKFGIGADGLLVVERSKKADFTMRIINADGSEAEMCGNGARCFAFWVTKHIIKQPTIAFTFQTIAGIICADVDMGKKPTDSCTVSIGLSDPKGLALDAKVKVGKDTLPVDFVNTGVPHAVLFVRDIDNVDVKGVGAAIRYHKHFAPAGTNVNFVQAIAPDEILIRTYERGVEDETLSCGTGTCAASIITALRLQGERDIHCMSVIARSGEVLKVDFTKDETGAPVDVWMKGKAYEVFTGTFT